MFSEVYECKMCGKRVEEKCINDILADLDILSIKEAKRHFCKNGNLGIMEFLGFKKID